MKKRVLILCTGNSARSQMAEGLLRHDAGDRFAVESAGSKPGVVRSEAIQVMQEIGIDISAHRSKHLDEFLGQVMAAITRQLGAVSSMLRVRNFEQNTLSVELVFQNGRVMTPDEAKFPESWRSLSLVEQRAATFLDRPTTVTRILDSHSPIPEALRFNEGRRSDHFTDGRMRTGFGCHAANGARKRPVQDSGKSTLAKPT